MFTVVKELHGTVIQYLVHHLTQTFSFNDCGCEIKKTIIRELHRNGNMDCFPVPLQPVARNKIKFLGTKIIFFLRLQACTQTYANKRKFTH